MAYLDIDRKRFTYLLSLGAREFELKQFFSDCRIQLIQRGGKVQNLPHGFKARIRTLAIELPPSTDEVLQTWFAKHLTMVDPDEAEVIIGVFKRYEEVGEELPEEEARRFARSCLVHLFSKNPPQSLLEFLKTPIGGTTTEHGDEAINGQSDVPVDNAWLDSLPQMLLDLVQGKDVDEHLETFPPDLANFISGLQSAALGELEEARRAAEGLSADSSLRSRLEQFLREQDAKKTSNESSARGIRIQQTEPFEGTFDYEQDEVLAYCTRADKPTAVFVHPIAVVRGGRILLLTEATRRELFPTTGDVMAFPGPGHPRQPRRGEVGIWRVEEHPTDKATHFHLASDKRPVYELRPVPFPSTDYDSVREYLKDYGGRSSGELQPPLFQLNDGLIVGRRSERADLSRDEAFEEGLPRWNSLPAIRIDGRLFVAGPLPKEQGIYECAGLASAVRKLFRASVGRAKESAGLTRSQLNYLVQSISSVETGVNALRLQRIKAQLERLGDQQEAFDALVEELMNQSNIKQRIDQLVEQEASRQLKEKDDLQSAIARLQKERGEWEQRVQKQRDEYRKLPQGLSKAVKSAFESARVEGLSTLGQVAVFQALSSPLSAPPTLAEAVTRGTQCFPEPIVRDLTPNDRAPVDVLKAFGVSAQRATAFALVGEAAYRAGLMVCIRGIAARPVVEGWAKAVAKRGVLVDSTVGLIDDSTVREALAREPAPDVLALLDANLSALDIYAKPLSDLVMARLTDPSLAPHPVILLALSDGIAALPLPNTFAHLSVVIDLDGKHRFRNGPVSDIEDLMSELTNPEDGTLYSRLWRPAADRLRVQIEEFDPEQLALVLSVLASQPSAP